jgi:hypothetical protein
LRERVFQLTVESYQCTKVPKYQKDIEVTETAHVAPQPKPIDEREFREHISHLSLAQQALQLAAVGLALTHGVDDD